MSKVYWHGRHPTFPGYSSPLGKLHKQGIQHLRSLGWHEVPVNEEAFIPAFAWTTKKAADFPSTGENLPLVRPLPQTCTQVVDDKHLLARLVAGHSGLQRSSPATRTDLSGLLDELVQNDDSGASSIAQQRWFVKHRHGVKGTAVQVMQTATLRSWLETRLATASAGSDFVVQREVAPPAIWEGRKFAVRCHALVAARGHSPPAAWLHRDVLVLPHAVVYDPSSDEPAVHISQSGKHHPPPVLATEVPPAHPAAQTSLWPRLRCLVGHCLSAAHGSLIPSTRCEVSTLYSLLACDVALRDDGTPYLLEVNSHCAIADGTMSAVDADVYTRLVADVASLIVLPAVEAGTDPCPGGFEPLEDAFSAFP